jgi:hypothetical protein
MECLRVRVGNTSASTFGKLLRQENPKQNSGLENYVGRGGKFSGTDAFFLKS